MTTTAQNKTLYLTQVSSYVLYLLTGLPVCDDVPIVAVPVHVVLCLVLKSNLNHWFRSVSRK